MGFMAAADLPALLPACARAALTTAALRDRRAATPGCPRHALRRVAARALPARQVERWEGGHLLHEAEPERAARRIATILAEELRLA